MTARVFAPEPEVCTVREKFAATRRELSEAQIERDGEKASNLVIAASARRSASPEHSPGSTEPTGSSRNT